MQYFDSSVVPVLVDTRRYIEDVLNNYSGEFNDLVTRSLIAGDLDGFLYTWSPGKFSVQCDRANNTPYICDMNDLIVDVELQFDSAIYRLHGSLLYGVTLIEPFQVGSRDHLLFKLFWLQ